MNNFDAAVEWLVQSGRAKSKGEARRNLAEALHDPDMRAWYGSALVNDIAGAAAPMASIANRDIAYSGQTAGAAAQMGIDLANRTIAHMATEARKIVKAEDFTPPWMDPGADDTHSTPLERLTDRIAAWWKRNFRA